MSSNKDKKAQYRKLWLEIIKLFYVALATVPFAVPWGLHYAKRIASPYYWKGIWVVILIFVILYIAFGRTYGAFRISAASKSEIIYSQFLAVFFTDAIMFMILFLLAKRLPVLWPLIVLFALQMLLVILWTLFAYKQYYNSLIPAKTLVIWDTRESLDELISSYDKDKRFDMLGSLYVVDCVRNIPRALKDIEVVFLCGIHSHERNQIIKYCVMNGIRAFVIPRIGDVIMSGAESMHLFHLPMLALEKYNPSPLYLAMKRAFDVIVSAVALIILSPLMLVIAVLIRRDGGTAFYRQVRLTKNGKAFEVLKFRSMRMDAEKDGVARLSTGDDDDRITPIGRFIRKCRIDELPQLINILRGDMSIVGPRPERPEIAEQYEAEMPEFRLRLQTKAGLTGRAQVFGKYNTTPYDKLLMDLQYIADANVIEDLRIIFATVKILFLSESTEGVSENQTNALMGGNNNSSSNSEDNFWMHR